MLTAERVRALLGTARTRDFLDLRDTAIIRLLLDTGMRRDELLGLKTSDIDHDVAIVLGKGRRERSCPFGKKCAMALDRYRRARSRHRHADLPALWLARDGALTRPGLQKLLGRRCAAAGVPHIHPHQFRHTFAHDWLSAGGNEGDLMRLTGWRSRTMLTRDAYRRLSPGHRTSMSVALGSSENPAAVSRDGLVGGSPTASVLLADGNKARTPLLNRGLVMPVRPYRIRNRERVFWRHQNAIRNKFCARGPWRSVEQVEFTMLEWIGWYSHPLELEDNS